MERELRIKQLENALVLYNEKYRLGKPDILDKTYDSLKEELKNLDPNNSLLQKAIIEEVADSERKEALPIPMYSLEFCKNWLEYYTWMIKNNLQEEIAVLTPKLDGMSLLCEDHNSHAWTRGDGLIGQNSDKFYAYINKNRINPTINSTLKKDWYNWGEAMILAKDWLKIKELVPQYKSPRNCVAGLFNSDKNFPEKLLPYVTYIRYGFSDISGNQFSKEKQLENLNTFQPIKIPFKVIKFGDLTKELVDEKFKLWRETFDMDGIVIDVNSSELRQKLGREANNNPKYARALKLGWEEIKRTKITDIKIQVSKDGRLKPVGIIKPVTLAGATVTNCSLYNVKNMYDKGIGIGTEVDIIRSGEVIPKIIKVVTPINNKLTIAQQLIDLISRDLKLDYDKNNPILLSQIFKWDETYTDYLLIDRHPLWDIAENAFFFNMLEIEYFDEPSIKKLYYSGFKTIETILSITREEILKIEGFGESMADYLMETFKFLREEGVDIYYLAAASNKFERMGVKILSEVPYENWVDGNLLTKEELKDLPNFGEIRAQLFLDGLPKFKNFISKLPIKILKPKVETFISDRLKGKIFVFTGFRDKDIEQKIILNGGAIGNDVSKNTTTLIVKQLNVGQNKEVKALKLGIETLELQPFIDKYLN